MIKNAQAVIDQADIREVLERLNVKLNNRGACACPVHGGKKMNFHVKDNIGRCFSQCGKTFDSVELVREIHNSTFPEAIEFIARIYGIELQYSENRDRTSEIFEAKKADTKKLELYNMTAVVSGLYVKGRGRKLTIGNRKFKKKTLDLFGVGMVTQSTMLADSKTIINKGALQELGLIKVSKTGAGFFDHLRKRWTFPIFDVKGNIAGFSGRKFKDDTNAENPKYINSSESLIYNKSNLLYGLFQGARSIRTKKFAYIVEGNTDVLSLFDQGIQNVVAPCGTALTPDQCMILKRYCPMAILLYDGDDAGQKAARRNVPPLLEVGFSVKIVSLPEKEDPDSFIRKGVQEFKNYIDENTKDALIELACEDYDKRDVQKKDSAIQQASELIALVKSDIQRSFYVDAITKIFGRDTKVILKDEIKSRLDKRRKKGTSKLTLEQQRDMLTYGVYEHNNKYYESWTPEDTGTAISNFIVKPIMLIVGSAHSRRLVQMVNQFGKSFVKDVDSDDFVELASFKKQVERMGNFLFKGKPDSYLKIKAKVYSSMQTAYPIFTLGYHKAGFWAWSNGVSVGGSFIGVDIHGIIEFDSVKYFLPSFSDIHAMIKSDDQDNSHEEDKKFIYKNEGEALNLNNWAIEISNVFGKNGAFGIGFYFAALFRDLIFKRLSFFPHLNMFGPKGSGKSYLAESLTAMFGMKQAPFNLAQGTQVGLARKFAQRRNGIIFLDEYSDDVDYKRIETLKGAYDGAGHEKGVKSTDNRTVRTQVNSAVIICGQHQPVRDIALFERCISLNFNSTERTAEQQERATKLKAIEKSGNLSQITSQIVQYRDLVDQHFDHTYSIINKYIRQQIGGQGVEDRAIANHSILATVYAIMDEQFGLPMSTDDFTEMIVSHTLSQSKAIGNEDEISVFWDLVQYLLADDQIHHDHDLRVEINSRITVRKPDNSGSRVIDFRANKRLIYIRFTKVAPKYMEAHRRQFMKGGLKQGALKHYLRGHKAYVGFTKGCRFAGQTYSAWIFDCEKLGLEIPLSSSVLGGGLPDTDDSGESVSTATTGSTDNNTY